MGELHLEILVDRMRREFKVDANIGAPQVAYRETIGKAVTVEYTHRKQTGGAGQYAKVKFTFEPTVPGEGVCFVSAIAGGAVPREFLPAVEKGIMGGQRGRRAGRLPRRGRQGDPDRR